MGTRRGATADAILPIENMVRAPKATVFFRGQRLKVKDFLGQFSHIDPEQAYYFVKELSLSARAWLLFPFWEKYVPNSEIHSKANGLLCIGDGTPNLLSTPFTKEMKQ